MIGEVDAVLIIDSDISAQLAEPFLKRLQLKFESYLVPGDYRLSEFRIIYPHEIYKIFLVVIDA